MAKVVELRQDRSLIQSNFDGYKLSLDPVPILRQDLSISPLKAEPNDEQYSLLHAELFCMQNLLVVDPWARTQSYFVNSLGELIRCSYEDNKGRPEPPYAVYPLGLKLGDDGWSRGDYNFSVRFLSEKFCLVCDGVQTIYLFDTGDRLKPTEWKLVTSSRVVGESLPEEEKNYIIFDSRLDIIQGRKQISILLGHVDRVESTITNSVSHHFLFLHWIKWSLEESVWRFQIVDTLEGKGTVYYCAFESRSESVVLSSNQEFKWRSMNFQANVGNQRHVEDDIIKFNEESNHFDGISWSQTDEELVLKIQLIPEKDKKDYNVKSQGNNITVKCSDEVLLDHELFDKVNVDLITWTIENNFLIITLIKSNSGMVWTSLLENGVGPRETIGKIIESNFSMEQKPIANLEAPIEDCDFPMGTVDDEICISRYNLSLKTVTHTIVMGSTPPLFFTSLRPGSPLALATRQDVDCCLWQQQYNPSNPDDWSMRHEGNLHAFGYVQASKQQKKFLDCSPDLGYALIAESHRHIFLYKTKYDSAGGLRNRNGTQVTIGKQHLITLEDTGEVLGLTTANSVATILTEKSILFLQIET